MANPKSNNSHESVDQQVARIELTSTIQSTGLLPGFVSL